MKICLSTLFLIGFTPPQIRKPTKVQLPYNHVVFYNSSSQPKAD